MARYVIVFNTRLLQYSRILLLIQVSVIQTTRRNYCRASYRIIDLLGPLDHGDSDKVVRRLDNLTDFIRGGIDAS